MEEKNMTLTVHQFMKALIEFESQSILSDFNHIFGKDIGETLWSEFLNQCNSNTTLFYRIMDDQQKAKFEAYLLKSTHHTIS